MVGASSGKGAMWSAAMRQNKSVILPRVLDEVWRGWGVMAVGWSWIEEMTVEGASGG